MTAATTEPPVTTQFVTVPTAADKTRLPLDKLRSVVRLREGELIAFGILVRVGRHRLVRADRLADLATAVGGKAVRA